MPHNAEHSSSAAAGAAATRQQPASLQRLDSRPTLERLVHCPTLQQSASILDRVAAALPSSEADVELVCAAGVILPCSSHILRLFSPLLSDLLLLSERGATNTSDDGGHPRNDQPNKAVSTVLGDSAAGDGSKVEDADCHEQRDGGIHVTVHLERRSKAGSEASAGVGRSVSSGAAGRHSAIGVEGGAMMHRLDVQGEEAVAWAELLALLLPVCPRAVVTWENASRVASVADRYHFPAPLRWVQEFLANPCTGLCTSATAPHAVLKALLLAERFGFQDVRKRCLNFIHSHGQRMELTAGLLDARRGSAGDALASLSDALCQAVQGALQRRPKAPLLATNGSGRGLSPQVQLTLCPSCKHCKYSTACGYCLKCYN